MKVTLRILLVLLAIILGLAAFKWLSSNSSSTNNSAAKPKPKVDGVIASSESLSPTVEFSGEFLPSQTIEVIPEVSGKIQSILVQEGGTVSKGQVMVVLDDQEWRAGMEKAEANYALAKTKAERLKPLAENGSVSKLEYEEAFYSAQQRAAELNLASIQVNRCQIKAPFSGKIGLFQLSPGQFVKAGEPLFQLLNTQELDLLFQVPSAYLPYVQANDSMWIRLPNNQLKGISSPRISPNLDADYRNSMVKARILNPNGDAHAGDVVQVILKPTSKSSVWIPSQAVIPQIRGFNVAIVKSAKAVFVPVELGARTENKVEIIKGLNPGDTVLTSGLLQIKPGDSISVHLKNQGSTLP